MSTDILDVSVRHGGAKLSTGWIVTIIVIAVLAVIAVVLYFLGKKAQKRQEEQREQMDAMKQTVSMLVIDKKKMRLKDAGLPQAVIDQTPKAMRLSKLPIVKAKIGPQVMSLVCDAAIFDSVPVKKEVKATISGIYITGVKGLHGKQNLEPVKKSKFRKLVEQAQEKAGAKPL